MLNSMQVMGRITKDLEKRSTPSGASVLKFTIANESDYKPKDGSDRKVDFLDCEAWNGTADFIEKFFSKGRMIVLTGRMESDKWEDKDGNKRVSWKLRVASAYFADSKRDGSGQTPLGKPDEDYPVVEDDGDLPF